MFNIVPEAEASVETLIKSIDKVVINPIIFFLFAVAIVYFLYGVVQYLLSPGNEEVRKKSKSHMIWGIVGLFIMVGVFGIMNVILKTFNITKIQVNNNGDFNVTGTNLNDVIVKDGTKTGQDIFGGSLDVSSDVNAPDLDPSVFVTSPFPTYKEDPLCWNRAVPGDKANTEYDALDQANKVARAMYLKENGILAKDPKGDGYPVIFDTKVMYNKDPKVKAYYAWLDARAPKGNGDMSNCTLEILKPAPDIAQSVFTNGDSNLSTTTRKNTITDFTKSPFTKSYIPSALCWREELYSNATTEYQALQKVKERARNQYLHDNGFSESTPISLPKLYAVLTSFDKVTKNYYAWIDSRGPTNLKTMKDSDCDLNEVLHTTNESQKLNPLLGSYASNMTYYRVIGSGVDTTQVGARSLAINNALVQIAKMKGLQNTSSILYTILPEEKYYPPTPATATTPAYPYFDYWLVIQSKR